MEVEEREIVTKVEVFDTRYLAFTLLAILCQDTADSLERAKTGVKRQQDSIHHERSPKQTHSTFR